MIISVIHWHPAISFVLLPAAPPPHLDTFAHLSFETFTINPARKHTFDKLSAALDDRQQECIKVSSGQWIVEEFEAVHGQ
jgi:hypothetical protein